MMFVLAITLLFWTDYTKFNEYLLNAKTLSQNSTICYSGLRHFIGCIDSRLKVFEDLGHVPHEEDPQATVAVVKDFLAQTD